MWWLLACADEAALSTEGVPDELRAAVVRGDLSLRFPILEVDRFTQTVGVDHDPADYSDGSFAEQTICRNYDGRGFPWCYDGHEGSDWLLEGGFDAMDAGSATIVAAAAGVVTEVVDGHYDRCHATTEGIDCDGHEMEPNYVRVEHEGGYTTRYLHMMNGAMGVEVGDEVECGDPLGLVGSSGYSSAPHLHLQLEDADGEVIDPYAGEYSQPATWWTDQGDPEGLPKDVCG
ncbi:MAG: M23 family metallopeptidase [Myxococcota bacterium]